MYRVLDVRIWETRRRKEWKQLLSSLEELRAEQVWLMEQSCLPIPMHKLMVLLFLMKHFKWGYLTFVSLISGLGQTSIFVLTPSAINGREEIVLEKVIEIGWSWARAGPNSFLSTYWSYYPITFHLGRKLLLPQHYPLQCDPSHQFSFSKENAGTELVVCWLQPGQAFPWKMGRTFPCLLTTVDNGGAVRSFKVCLSSQELLVQGHSFPRRALTWGPSKGEV